MAKRHKRNEQFYNQSYRPLQELKVGDSVQIPNKDGKYLRRWTKTGRMVETHGNRQYQVRVDGSSRITLRNRRFPRKIYLVVDGPPQTTPGTSDPSGNPEHPQKQNPDELMDIEQDINVTTPCQPKEIEMEVDDTTDVVGSNTGAYIQPVGPPPLRQPSSRRKQAPRNLFPRILGKSHGFSDSYEDDHVNSSCGNGERGMCRWWLSYLPLQSGQ